ncbi:MAG: DUF3772 domain-containing protein [Methyloligellaceae bacterium]
MTIEPISRLAAVLAMLCVMAMAALAEEPDGLFQDQTESAQSQTANIAAPLTPWQATLRRIEKALEREKLSDSALEKIRDELDRVRAEAAAFIKKHEPRLVEAKAQLEKLGPAPEKKQTAPESDPVAKERAKLTRLVSEIGGAVKTAGVIGVRATQLREQGQTIARSRFSQQLLERSKSPLQFGVWKDVSREAAASFRSLHLLISDWIGSMRSRQPLIITLLAAIVVFFPLWWICRIWVNRLRYPAGPGDIEFFERAGSAIWVTGLRALPYLGLAAVIYGSLYVLDVLPPRIDKLATTLCLTLAGIAAINALLTTMLAPARPQWRIFPASDARALRINRLLGAIVVVYGIDLFLARLNEILVSPLPLTIAQSFFASVVFAVLLAAVLRTPVGDPTDQGEARRPRWLAWIRLPLWVLVIAILTAGAFGYIALARFLATQVVVTGSILVVLYLFYITNDEIANSIVDRNSVIGRWLMQRMSVSSGRAEQISLLALLLLHLLLITIGLPLLLLQWGFSWDDVQGWLKAAYFGFEIGHLRISLATILLAVVLFAAGLYASRLIASWLDRRILSRAGLERGLRDSIRTGLGYVGIVIAVMLAVSYIGADFSDLAIVAGALSVGIGFGLQTVVNNFVSGIILLAERPIKVGDWIVVGNEEGHVRRINVRATEIETFERSHVIIPNSSLIGGEVKNWMLRSPVGRVEVIVGVSYGSDPEQVREILLDVARAHERVLERPEPFVRFMDFGASSLDFSLRSFVANIDDALEVRSDLRFAIFAAFRDAGIEIPFPQRDINLRDIDRLEEALGNRRDGNPESGGNTA